MNRTWLAWKPRVTVSPSYSPASSAGIRPGASANVTLPSSPGPLNIVQPGPGLEAPGPPVIAGNVASIEYQIHMSLMPRDVVSFMFQTRIVSTWSGPSVKLKLTY